MKEIIEIRRSREYIDREEEKELLREKLDDLFWNDPIAYVELSNFCQSSRSIISPRVKSLLIREGFLFADGALPSTTNEVVYEATTGQKPFWL